MSFIYSQRQFGNEDQWWLAHFIISAVMERPINIYDDRKQVRDVLYVNDLIRAFQLAINRIDMTAGWVSNIWVGLKYHLSLGGVR